MLEIARQPVVAQPPWRAIGLSLVLIGALGGRPHPGGHAAEAPAPLRSGRERPGGDVARRRHLHRRHGDRRRDRDRDRPRDRQRPPVVTGRDDAALPSRLGGSAGRRLPDDRPGERIGPQTAHAGADDRPDSHEGVVVLGAEAPLRAVARRTQCRDDLDSQRNPGTFRRRHRWTPDREARHRRHPDELRLRSESVSGSWSSVRRGSMGRTRACTSSTSTGRTCAPSSNRLWTPRSTAGSPGRPTGAGSPTLGSNPVSSNPTGAARPLGATCASTS